MHVVVRVELAAQLRRPRRREAIGTQVDQRRAVRPRKISATFAVPDPLRNSCAAEAREAVTTSWQSDRSPHPLHDLGHALQIAFGVDLIGELGA
jgi:hypothetical protein